MNRLRAPLRSARQAYRSVRYPGNLSAELLPRPGRTAMLPSRRLLLLGGVATSGAAAAVMFSLLMSRASDLPRPWPIDPSQRALVDWLPIAPDSVPLPKFQAPSLPEWRLEVPGVERYRGLALPYPTFKLPAPNLMLDSPALPDLPGQGLNWLRKVLHSVEAA